MFYQFEKFNFAIEKVIIVKINTVVNVCIDTEFPIIDYKKKPLAHMFNGTSSTKLAVCVEYLSF